ncbi:MAG: hypothetical protein AELANPGJ_03603 [Anaerolineae bacterium]|nr:hypothetical protein [Anaerolineae bacterium]
MKDNHLILFDKQENFSIDVILVEEEYPRCTIFFSSGKVLHIRYSDETLISAWGRSFSMAMLFADYKNESIPRIYRHRASDKKFVKIYETCPAYVDLTQSLYAPVPTENAYVSKINGYTYVAFTLEDGYNRFAYGNTQEQALNNLHEKILRIETFPKWLRKFAHVVPTYAFVELLEKYYYPTLR